MNTNGNDSHTELMKSRQIGNSLYHNHTERWPIHNYIYELIHHRIHTVVSLSNAASWGTGPAPVFDIKIKP